jgi:hypothetical protein
MDANTVAVLASLGGVIVGGGMGMLAEVWRHRRQQEDARQKERSDLLREILGLTRIHQTQKMALESKDPASAYQAASELAARVAEASDLACLYLLPDDVQERLATLRDLLGMLASRQIGSDQVFAARQELASALARQRTSEVRRPRRFLHRKLS